MYLEKEKEKVSRGAFVLGLVNGICWGILALNPLKLVLLKLAILKKFAIVLQYYPKFVIVL